LKIFISWSGPVSREIAEALRDWLPSVLQTVEPYVSSEDIDKGARWSVDVSRELEASSYGILCVTADNVKAPWLNFEAGALSKSFDKSRVSPFLFGISRSEVTGPLVQFQSTIYDHDDVYKLVKSINSVSEAPLEEARLNAAFEVWWPKLKESMERIKELPEGEGTSKASDRGMPDMVVEILELMRAQQKTLSEIMDGPLATAGEPPFDVNPIVASIAITHAVVERGAQAENIKAAEAEQLRTLLRAIMNLVKPLSGVEYDKRVHAAEEVLKRLEDPSNIVKMQSPTSLLDSLKSWEK
jgi:hypothetical protein